MVLWLKGNSVSTLPGSYTAGNKREITLNLLASLERNIHYGITSTVIVINVRPGWLPVWEDKIGRHWKTHAISLLCSSTRLIHTAVELNRLSFVRFQVLSTLLPKIQVFWDVTLCHGVSSLWCFKESWCLHLQDQASLLPVFPNLETSKRTCCMTWYYIPQTCLHTFILHKPECVETINRLLNTALALVEKRNLLQTYGMWCLSAVICAFSFFCFFSWIKFSVYERSVKCMSLGCRIQVFKDVTVLLGLFAGILKQATWCLHVSKCGWQVLRNYN